MEVIACPKCGSLRIYQATISDGLFPGGGEGMKYVCRECNYQGMPIIFSSEKEYKTFIEKIKNKPFMEKIPEKEEGKKEKRTENLPKILIFLAISMVIEGLLAIYHGYTIRNSNILSNLIWVYYITIFLISAMILPYGFIRGKRWSYTLAGILYVLSLPIGLFFLYLLTRPHVKEYLGVS